MKKLPVRGIKDLIAVLAVVRPGPASGEAKAAYIRRANEEESPDPPHPRLKERLRATYGMMLYEEDLMAAIATMTGWPLARADEMRSALLLAQDDAAEMAVLEQEFVGASLQTAVSETDAAKVWEILARFAAYSFNKAHAASYAQLAWQSVYLKTHYPVEFACAVLNSYGGFYPLRTVAADFARGGVILLPPNLNVSEVASTVEAGAVRIGLAAIKRVMIKTRKIILEQRSFRDLRDLLERAPVPYRELEALVLCGACDELPPLTPENYPFAHEDLLGRLKVERSVRALEGFVVREAHGARVETYRSLVRIRNELAFLDMHPSDHPMRVLRAEAARAGCITTAELPSKRGEFARIAGVVAAARRLAARGGRIMQFVTLEDEHGLVEAVLFPGVYASRGDPVTNPGPFLLGGRVAEDHGDVHLLVSEVKPFHQRARPYGSAELV